MSAADVGEEANAQLIVRASELTGNLFKYALQADAYRARSRTLTGFLTLPLPPSCSMQKAWITAVIMFEVSCCKDYLKYLQPCHFLGLTCGPVFGMSPRPGAELKFPWDQC